MKTTLAHNTSPHLHADDMLAMIEGRLPGLQASKMKAHIDECALCAEAMEGLRLMPVPARIKWVSRAWRAHKSPGVKHHPLGPTFNLLSVVIITSLIIFTAVYVVHVAKQKELRDNKEVAPATATLSAAAKELPDTASVPAVINTGSEVFDRKVVKPPHATSQTIESLRPIPPHITSTEQPTEVSKPEGLKNILPVLYLSDYKVEDVTGEYEKINAQWPRHSLEPRYSDKSNFNKDQTDLLTRDNVTEYFTLLSHAMQHLRKGHYGEAITIYNDILLVNDADVNAIFYKGFALEKKQNFDEAIFYFSKIIEHHSSSFTEEATYHKALCLWNLNRRDEARQMFLSIARSSSFYNHKAREYLK